MITSFTFAATPRILFGTGSFNKLPGLISDYGKRVLLVTGGASFRNSSQYRRLINQLEEKALPYFKVGVTTEPSPELIDQAVNIFMEEKIELVVAIGGGSVIDAGKAISAMLPLRESVLTYIEGVGAGKIHPGEKLPFIAVPTTSGTGSEATNNAVLSRIGKKGFKKSLRHDHFIPNIALLDPRLTLSCPAGITATSGLDAFVQLLEAYTSTNASAMTDSLILDAIQIANKCLIPACTDQSQNINVRAGMAYASLISGIALTNAGLGVIHGLASPLGGYLKIPHGVVCGTLLAEVVKTNVNSLLATENPDNPYLQKYARLGGLLVLGQTNPELNNKTIKSYCQLLVQQLENWLKLLKIPRLSQYGATEKDLPKIIEKTGQKNNPVELSADQLTQILKNRL